MIYELRTYTLKPGTVGDMIKAASTVSQDIRGDKYGKLEGYWSTEIGPLNQVLHLWSYQDLNERMRLRAELASSSACERRPCRRSLTVLPISMTGLSTHMASR